jgi:phosphomethylpyrimidine synthase
MEKSLIDMAREGIITPAMGDAASCEGVEPDTIRSGLADGSLVIMTRDEKYVAIGKGVATKINANIGTSSVSISTDEEINKARVAQQYGADTLTDLSMGGDISSIRRSIFLNTILPITTVPIYQSVVEQGIHSMTEDHILDTIADHVDEGVSSVVLHCIEPECIENLRNTDRIMGMVSKGGAFTCAYMLSNQCGNPFIDNFDHILEILKQKDVVLSLGNTMRGGCIHDIFDTPQIQEMQTNMKLAKRAHESGVQVIVEGTGGHVQASDIEDNVKYYKQTGNYPLFVAGPLPIDVAVGYDHIAGCVGASMAAGAGADYLCYITPSEHLRLPSADDVKDGLIAFRIAAHIGDSIKYGSQSDDLELAKRRAAMDWEGQMRYAIDSEKPGKMCPDTGSCSMCGDFCAIDIMHDLLGHRIVFKDDQI